MIRALIALALLSATANSQKTWYVDVTATAPGKGTLSEPFVSIDDAIRQSATVDGDTVSVAPGVYFESLFFAGKKIRVIAPGGPDQTIIDPAYTDRGVMIMGGQGPETLLRGFEIRRGIGGGGFGSAGTAGGGIAIRDASPSIESCRIVACGSPGTMRPNFGGGMIVFDGSPIVSHVEFIGNYAEEHGGGVAIWGLSWPEFRHCTFSGNRNGETYTSYGGGVLFFPNTYQTTTPLFEFCDIRFNSSLYGGGVSGPCKLFCCNIEFNQATLGGAGIVGVTLAKDCVIRGNHLECSASGLLPGAGGGSNASNLEGCLIQGNSAALGGGIRGGTAVDCVIVDNTASSYPCGGPGGLGGGAYDATLDGCRVLGNLANVSHSTALGEGGGIYGGSALRTLVSANQATLGAATSMATLDFCTLVGNSNGSLGATARNSVLWSTAGPGADPSSFAEYCCVSGGFPGTGNFGADPLVWSPMGGTPSIPMEGSPLVDAGDSTAPPDPDGSRADIGWVPFDPRPVHQPSVYCTPSQSAGSCRARIGSLGVPSLSTPHGLSIRATLVPPHSNGMLFLGVLPASLPYQGATLCVSPPLVRTLVQNSGGSTGCSGEFGQALTTQLYVKLGVLAGDMVYAQYWYRDSAGSLAIEVSDALGFTVLP